jgi:hypothetical protein
MNYLCDIIYLNVIVMKKKLFILGGLLVTVSVFSQWSLTGNAGTNSATNFIGTTDSQPLVFRVSNTHAGYIQPFSNTSLGYMSFGYSAVSAFASNNTAFGSYAMRDHTTGSWNAAFGTSALSLNTNGSHNVAVGPSALRDNVSGTNNVAVGSGAASNNNTGSGLTVIGSGANARNLLNATAIGADANATANNWIRIGNTSVTRIEGQVNWTFTSDVRIKKNVRSDVPGLAFINKLQPVTFTFDLDAIDKITDAQKRENIDPLMSLKNKEAKEAKEKIVYTGFIAQEVEKAAKDVGFNFSGVDAPANEKSLYGLRYAEFVMPLVKSVQELSAQNISQQNQIEKLTELVNILLKKEESAPILIPETSHSTVPGASLEQNNPNPFSSSATIAYTLPQSFRSAKIIIMTMSGQVLRLIPISGTEAGKITISAGSLPSGIYYYSLYVNDILVDTKRMIVT